MKLVFFGDSLTDLGRNRDKKIDNYSSYGMGYVFEIASHLYFEKPGYYKVINRGNGGDKVTNLYDRYQEDVIDEKPDVLTILIGVNDVWHELGHHNGTPIDVFEETYLKMLGEIKKQLPNIKIILMEPFFCDGDATRPYPEGFKAVFDYAKVVKRVAEKTGSIFIPLQDAIDESVKNGGATQILYDGVHTNPGGARLIALKWLEEFHKLTK